MSKEEYVSVHIPRVLFDMATKLGTVRVGEVMVHLHSEKAIVREAIARGLKLMLIERMISDTLAEKYAKKNAVSIYTSLLKGDVERASELRKCGEALAGLPEAEV